MKKIIFILFAVALVLSTGSVFADTSSEVQGTDEHTIVFHQPPSNWDAVKATDAELEYYFYPARPTDETKLADWKKAVSGKWTKPEFKKAPANERKASKAIMFSTNATSQNWSGIVSGQTAARVTAFWSVPAKSADSTHRPALAAEWIGLGGVSSTPLIQEGTSAIVDASGNVTYKSWYEIVGTNLSNLPVYFTAAQMTYSPGDTIYGDVSFTKGSPGTARFYMSHGTYVMSFAVTSINYNLDLPSAEWILEKPTVSGQTIDNTNLAKFGQVTFARSAWASTPTGTANFVTAAPAATNYFTMKTASGTIEATPTALDSTGGFNVNWVNYK